MEGADDRILEKLIIPNSYVTGYTNSKNIRFLLISVARRLHYVNAIVLKTSSDSSAFMLDYDRGNCEITDPETVIFFS